jgi:hypothetical protein
MRLSKDPASSADAVGMLEEVKAGRLAGIYCVNWQKAALRAQRFGKSWWTVIPPGEEAILMLDPDNPSGGQPLIAFRRELDPRDKDGCGKLKTDKTLTPYPARLDAALLKAWASYRLWQTGQVAPCSQRPGVPARNVMPPGFCQVEHVVKVAPVIRGNPYVGKGAVPTKLPPSIPPGKTYELKVTVSPSLKGTGRVVNLAILNSGGANGTATVTPAQITSDTVVTVTGGAQTQPYNGGKLKVVAGFNGKIIASSEGFSICAHPHSIKISLYEPVKSDSAVGAIVRMFFDRTAASADLGRVRDPRSSARSGLSHRSSGSGIFTGAGTVNGQFHALQFFPANAENLSDHHKEPMPEAGPEGTADRLQLFVFQCARCGMVTPAVVPNSGFNILHKVFKSGKNWKYRFRKIPRAVGILAFKSKPGIGTVTLPDQDLK